MKIAKNQAELIGNTPILKIPSLSKITGCEILVKCESFNPGGSIKDRAALKMVQNAIDRGDLKEGMTIVEGTAGNTGIGLALVAKSFGLEMLAVMPKGQTLEKQSMIEAFGAKLKLVDPVPFANENHFYHTAQRLGSENPNYWWANQFENNDNFLAHYEHTAPEIYQQLQGELDFFVCAAGTGGTIGGNSKFLKEKIPTIKTFLVDPQGSGLHSFIKDGEFKAQGSSITEGIGIMRKTANFSKALLDGSFSIDDSTHISLSRHIKDQDGIILGTSSSLNVCAAFKLGLKNQNSGKRILTFLCDLGERSASKMQNEEFLNEKQINFKLSLEEIKNKLK
ncbi:MAG: cysteine synthase A [Halobacteriovoraceae bacterium]|nr:cysteine synthase A [Halobacteriovoraceae bacterium]|tara:strand:- start:6224 stop:7234 length:1011 start_codon:yes stop_codon:yes gene_type:complete